MSLWERLSGLIGSPVRPDIGRPASDHKIIGDVLAASQSHGNGVQYAAMLHPLTGRQRGGCPIDAEPAGHCWGARRLPQRGNRLRAMVSPVVGASAASTSSRSTHFTL